MPSQFDFSEFEEPALGTELESVTESSSDSDFGDFDFSSFDEPASSSENTADAEPVKQYYSLTDPEILRAVDDLQNYLAAKHPEIGKVVSFTTFIKRMNQVMHVPVAGTSGVESESADILDSPAKVKDILEMMNRAYAAAGGEKASTNAVVRELERELNYNGLAYYEIPYDIEKYSVDRRENLSNLVTQYLYLLSSDAITRFADDMTNPKAIRTQVQLRTHSTVDTGLLINDINDYVAKYFPTDKYTVETTGSAALENTMSHLVIDSQMVSIVFSLVMVFIIIALSFKSGLAGLIGAIPLGLVILLNFMVMGFMGIRLDLCTSIVSSIAIGVGIDYTIHFMETYQHGREKSNDSESVTKATFKSSGKGIVTHAIAVGLGFLVLVFSKFIILRYIGILVAVVMFTSSMLAMTIIPGLLSAFDPKFMWSKDEKEAYKAKIEAEKK